MARIDWINERLEGEFDLRQEQVYRPDRNKEDWPLNEAEADTFGKCASPTIL